MARRIPINKSKLVYPVFIDFISYCLDEYWQKVFTSYAHGKLPKWLTFQDGVLICSKKKGQEPSKFQLISNPSPKENQEEGEAGDLYLKTREFLKREAGLGSDLDRLKVIEERVVPETWSQIKNPRNKQVLFSLFCDAEIKRLHLNTSQQERLWSLINLGILYKIINSSTIELKDGKISSISVLEFANGKHELDTSGIKKSKLGHRKNTKNTKKNPWKEFVDSVHTQVGSVRKLLKEKS